jgi:RNA polymerase primary sigma factor
MIADQRSPDPAEEAMTANEIMMLQEMLEGISEREAKILKMRYGIDHDHPMTLSEIGEELGLTRERIRQIENNAIRTLQTILSRKRGYQEDN